MSEKSFEITFSEKAIMLCKAGLMDDEETFEKIIAAKTPKKAKSLGRCVSPWDNDLWD